MYVQNQNKRNALDLRKFSSHPVQLIYRIKVLAFNGLKFKGLNIIRNKLHTNHKPFSFHKKILFKRKVLNAILKALSALFSMRKKVCKT